LLTGTANESASKKDKSNDPWARVDDDEHQEPRNESWQPFTEAAAATTIRAMLKALAACHAHGVVHRDVKPANFLYMREPNGSRRAKLSDFGLAARIKNSGDMLYVFPFPNPNTLYCPSVTFQVTNTTKD
jgi:serine/threonine protein kinase